jgi:hypothetical protein
VNVESLGGDSEAALPAAAPMMRLVPDVISVAPTAQLAYSGSARSP